MSTSAGLELGTLVPTLGMGMGRVSVWGVASSFTFDQSVLVGGRRAGENPQLGPHLVQPLLFYLGEGST